MTATCEKVEDRLQPPLDHREPLPCVLADQPVNHRRVGGNRHRVTVEFSPGPGQRQPLDEQQMFDLDDLLDVRPSIHAGAAFGLREAELRELRFPRAEHVRLDLQEIADLRSLEERAIGDFNRGDETVGHP